jgi:uncharacterized protein YcfJ
MTKSTDTNTMPNQDLVTTIDGPNDHPVGTGIGAASGAVAGAAIGTAVGGPVGATVGGAIGAAAGALAGRKGAEIMNPAAEEAYWSANYAKRDYVERGRPYTDYQTAYRYGWEAHARLGNRPFAEIETELERGWDSAKGGSKLAWTQAKLATRDAWQRLARG